MEVSVQEAAQRLGVDDSRVRSMLRGRTLSGRRLAGRWLVDADDLARRVALRPPSGRPLSPQRAWGLLSLLDGGSAPWLSPAGRSQVRSRLETGLRPAAAALVARAPGAEDAAEAFAVARWRAMFRARSELHPVVAHPAALPRLLHEHDVHRAGLGAAVAAGADLVSPAALDEVYVSPERWPGLCRRYQLREHRTSANLLVRVPRLLADPLGGRPPGPAVLAADLLEHDEQRVWTAGLTMLAGLVVAHGRQASS